LVEQNEPPLNRSRRHIERNDPGQNDEQRSRASVG
jgi:hypothetical protein